MMPTYYLSQKLLMTGYASAIMMSMISRNVLMIWLFMELALFIFMLINLNQSRGQMNSELIFYLLIQSSSSLGILISVVDPLHSPAWLMFFVLMKMGAFPFHKWFPLVTTNFSSLSFWLSMTFQKLPMLLILSNVSLKISSALILLLSLNILLASIDMSMTSCLSWLLSISSVANNSWLILLYVSLDLINHVFFFFYLFSLTLIFLGAYSGFTSGMVHFNENLRLKMVMISLLSLSGLPIFPLFFAKAFTIFYLSSLNVQFSILLVFLIANVVMVYSYSNFVIKKMTLIKGDL